MEFNVSLDASPRLQVDARAPLFASVMGSAADLGGGECVFRSQDGQTHVMTHQVLQALDRCRAFLTLAEHVQSVQQILPKVPGEGIARVLESLVSRRLLISEADFIAGLRGAASSASPARMRMIVRGGTSPVAIAPLLESLAQSSDWPADIERVQLLWDSADAEARSSGLAATRLFAERSACKTEWVDAIDLRASLRQLCGKDARQLAAAELIFGTAGGADHQGYNLALALAGGQRSFILDEQMRWPLQRTDDAARGLDLCAQNVRSAGFFPDLGSALAESTAPESATSAWRAHFDACGARLADLLADDGWRAGDLRGRALSECLSTSGSARIAATLTGSRGCHRGIELEDLFLLAGSARAAFAGDREAYMRQLGRGSARHGVDRAQLIRRSALVPLSVDGRGFLPFALPYGGAPGWTFSSMLHLVDPEALLLQLPDSIGIAAAATEIGRDIGKRARSRGPGQFVADYLATRTPDIQADTPAARMQTAAALLQDLAQSSDARLGDQVSEYVQYLRSELIGKLQSVAEAAGTDAPVHWLADLRSLITANGRALIDTTSARLSGDDEADTSHRALRQRLVQTAEAMMVWPVLWERIRAGELRVAVKSA